MPRFAKRHYIVIAEVLREAVSTGQSSLFPEFANTVDTLSHLFARDNPRFSRDRFFDACGIPQSPLNPSTHKGA